MTPAIFLRACAIAALALAYAIVFGGFVVLRGEASPCQAPSAGSIEHWLVGCKVKP